ncbi:AMP-binding protein [candidate division KSB1 bacterium]|nr:AMP-binding protein [candidate division KSB1 bacterium]
MEHCATQFKNESALSLVDGSPIDYEKLSENINKTSLFLNKLGIKAGDRVAILSENSPNWVIAFFAVTTMGAVVVPILPDFLPDQVQHILRHSSSKAIFISERQYDKIQDDDEQDTPYSIILIETFSKIHKTTTRERIKELLNEGGKEISRLKSAALRLTGKIDSDVKENDLASIIYTSGTTGHSKGVMLTHKNLVSNVLAASLLQPITVNDRFLSILPLSHTLECTVGMLVALHGGACTYYFEKPPSPKNLLEAFQKIKPTVMLSVPLIIEKIYKNRILPQFQKNAFVKKLYSSDAIRKKLHKIAGKKLLASFGGELHFFGIGGSKLSADVETFLRDAKFPYAVGYGLTETAPLLAGTNPAETKFQSTGRAIQSVQIKIASSDPYTREGEVLAKGPNVMKGYYNDPELTANVFTPDGWFKTGDLGILDRDDYLYIIGRIKNVIIGPSGENIYPEEIETKINECDYVLESIVFQDNDKLTARVHLNYEALDKNLKILSELELKRRIGEILKKVQQQVNKSVASFARINKIIEQTEPFEKTPTKKIKRFLYTS